MVLLAPLAVGLVSSFVVTLWLLGSFAIAMCGCCGGMNAFTPMFAWSVAWTLAPVGGLPLATATFSKSAFTLSLVQA